MFVSLMDKWEIRFLNRSEYFRINFVNLNLFFFEGNVDLTWKCEIKVNDTNQSSNAPVKIFFKFSEWKTLSHCKCFAWDFPKFVAKLLKLQLR